MSGKAYLALESGGTKLVASLADEHGQVLRSLRSSRRQGDKARESIANLISMGRALVKEAESQGTRVVATGFGFGGVLKRRSNHAYLCLHEDGWEQVDAAEELSRALPGPVFIENDCKVAALAEALLGAGRGADVVFYATIGTGIGGGLVRHGKIVELQDNGEAEIGHLLVEPGGNLCGCGGRGCLEAICSGPGMLQLAEAQFDSTPAIFEAWTKGDGEASRIVERCATHLARSLAAVMALMHPNRIVLGGGVASGNPAYVDLIRELTRPLVVSYFRSDFDLKLAELGELVVTQGAALYAKTGIEHRRRNHESI